MKRKSYLPPFGKVLTTSIFLILIGGGGLVFIFAFFKPTLGPRWMFFFFITIFGTGVALPMSYLTQRRFASQIVSGRVLIREAILFGVYLSLAAWLQLGRVLTNLIVVVIAIGFLLLEMLLRMAEKATFQVDEDDKN
jgi:hypothetical protein